MPKIPGEDSETLDEIHAFINQRRLNEYRSGITMFIKDEDTPETPQWHVDDNIKSQDLGFIIASGGGTAIPELYSLRRTITPKQIFEQKIKPFKDNGGLEAKAYITLVRLKLRFPNHTFLYEK